MAVLGDSPMYFFNAIGSSLGNGLSGGAPWFLGVFAIAILVYIAISLKLDRGALTITGLMGLGVMLQLSIIPEALFWGTIAVVALVAGYGFLNSARQGEG